jgi:hypothetical protein
MSWLSGWTHAKEIFLTGGASGTQSDYQIKTEIGYSRHMQKDFSDIRFTQSDGVSLLDTWLESCVYGMSATVWVKFPTTPEDGEIVTYYMYYGNDEALSNWDGNATFLQYKGATTSDFIESATISPTDIAYEAKIKYLTGVNVFCGISNSSAGAGHHMEIETRSSMNQRRLSTRNGSGSEYLIETPAIPTDAWTKLKMTCDGTTVYGYVDDDEIGTGGLSTYVTSSNLGLWFRLETSTSHHEYSFVRKYVVGPATHVFGNEKIDSTNILYRSKNRFTTPYCTEEGSNIDKLIRIAVVPIAEISNTTDDIVAAHQLSEATGYSLDQWGNLLQVQRTVAETDDHYRARLVSYALMYRRSGTPQHMVSNCAEVLGVDTSRITFSEGSGAAAFSITVFLSDIEDAGITLSDYVDIMSISKPGGVTMSLLSSGTFECKGISDAHDATKGYNNIANANPDGGVYAGLIGVI